MSGVGFRSEVMKSGNRRMQRLIHFRGDLRHEHGDLISLRRGLLRSYATHSQHLLTVLTYMVAVAE